MDNSSPSHRTTPTAWPAYFCSRTTGKLHERSSVSTSRPTLAQSTRTSGYTTSSPNAMIIHVAKPSALKKVVVHLFDGAHRIVPPNSSDNRLELLRGQGQENNCQYALQRRDRLFQALGDELRKRGIEYCINIVHNDGPCWLGNLTQE